MFVIVDPLNPTNNTARNSFRTPDVLKVFRAAFRGLKGLISKQYTLAKAQQQMLPQQHPWGQIGLQAGANESGKPATAEDTQGISDSGHGENA